jgi:hypothetical protein
MENVGYVLNAGGALGGDATRVQKPLESLAQAAQRINSATVNVGLFLDRWHGAKPEPTACGNGQIEAPLPHSGNLDRLFSAIERLEQRIDALNAIG